MHPSTTNKTTCGSDTSSHAPACCAGGTLPPNLGVIALARTDCFASYGMDDSRLPVVAVDGRGRALVLSAAGKLTLATKARVDGESFDRIVTS
jgi:hypothetical protein